MNKRLVVLSFSDGEVGVTLGNLFHYFYAPFDFEIVYVTVAPSADNATLTLDINDDGAAGIAAIDCAVAAVPGTWKSKHVGGTNDPVHVAAGSLMSLDANNANVDVRLLGQIWCLTGEVAA